MIFSGRINTKIKKMSFLHLIS